MRKIRNRKTLGNKASSKEQKADNIGKNKIATKIEMISEPFRKRLEKWQIGRRRFP